MKMEEATLTISGKISALAVAGLGLFIISACSTSNKVQPKQIGDASFSCEEIVAENKKIDAAEKEVDANRGVTGTNVASALFWLPGLAYTYYDAGQADELIAERRSWLAELYDEKGC